MGETFADRWQRMALNRGHGNRLSKMIACGPDVLPESAAPCLNFEEATPPIPIWDAFGSPSDWSQTDRERLAPYRMIGFDGAGNPICVDQGSGAVVLLDHEDRFRTLQFMNSSVPQLAECLLAYMSEKDPERFRSLVHGIDPAALAERSFWSCEATGLAE
jgi:hypothetical protein